MLNSISENLMIFFEDSDRIWENENALLKKGGICRICSIHLGISY